MSYSLFQVKICFKCDQEKLLSAFYKQPRNKDGHQGICKSCYSAYNRKHYRDNFEHYAAYQRERNKKPEVKRAKAFSYARWSRQNREKVRAQGVVGYAARKGLLVKTDCVECGSSEHIHGHHEEYSKPLEVVWLCAKCHHKRHV